MNSCILMAEIIQEPQLRYTSDTQLPIAEMMVQFEGMREEDPPSTLKVIGWGNLAQEIQQNYHQGDRILIEGRLGMNTIERPEGYKEKRAELTAQRLHKLSADATLQTVVSVPSVGVAPATPSPATPVKAKAPSPTKPANRPAPSTGDVEEATSSRTATYSSPGNNLTDYDDIPFVRPVESKTLCGDDLINSDIYRPKVGFEYHKF